MYLKAQVLDPSFLAVVMHQLEGASGFPPIMTCD